MVGCTAWSVRLRWSMYFRPTHEHACARIPMVMTRAGESYDIGHTIEAMCYLRHYARLCISCHLSALMTILYTSSPVNMMIDAGDKGALVACQPQSSISHVLGRGHTPERNLQELGRFGVLLGRVVKSRDKVAGELGRNQDRTDTIDPDTLRTKLVGERFGGIRHRRL